MYFTLRHLHAFQLTILATSLLIHSTNADWNQRGNNSLGDILSDASCPNFHSGRLSINDCHGYVDCMNGFEIDRADCEVGKLYSIRSENCEPEESVPVCPASLTDNPGNDRAGKPHCGDGFCLKLDGDCGVMHQCLIDPCEMTSCGENEECVASYCGGCHATCTLKLNSIDGAHVATRPPPTTTIETGSPSTEGAVTTRPPPATTTPLLIDDGGAWVQESGSYTSSTTPQVVHDGQDAVADWSTTMAPKTTQETVIVDPAPAGSTQVYIPSWSEHTCVATDETASKNKNRRLGSSWHSYFTSQYECCVNNFIYSLELFESCVGFDLETLEPVSGGNSEYYPIWKEAWFDTKSTKPKALCKATDGTEDGWMQTTFRPKKYLCCFEYFKWDFDNCLIA